MSTDRDLPMHHKTAFLKLFSCALKTGVHFCCYLLALLDKINAEIDFHDIGKQGNFSNQKLSKFVKKKLDMKR